MTHSITEAICFAITPCQAEAVETAASNGGNVGLYGLAKSIKYLRNGLYFCFALTIILSAVAGVSEKKSDTQYIFTAAAALSAGIMTITSYRLYNAALLFLGFMNSASSRKVVEVDPASQKV